MCRAFRSFLVCLIMLTLPVQAVSASLMALSMELPAQSSPGGMASNCHEHASPDEQDVPAGTQAFKSKACSPCCAGALIGAFTVPQTFMSAGNTRLNVMPGSDFKGYIPEGLERPPKRIS